MWDFKQMYEVHLEKGTNVLRIGSCEKKYGGWSNYAQGNVTYYKYQVFSSRDIVVGKLVQTTLCKSFNEGSNTGAVLGMSYKFSNFMLEFRGHRLPIKQVQMMTVREFLEQYGGDEKNKDESITVNLLGSVHFDFNPFAPLFFCCLKDTEFVNSKDYEILDPNFDFSAPSQNTMERFDDHEGEIQMARSTFPSNPQSTDLDSMKSISERLQELNDAKDFLSEEEYNRKRSDILSSL